MLKNHTLASLAMVLSFAAPAGAATVAELQAQINALMAQLASLQGGSTTATAGVSFSQNLTVGSTGSEVVALQQMLVAQGHLVMPAGVAYGYFGSMTKAAVAKWQVANGVSPAAGYWGPLSRAKGSFLAPVISKEPIPEKEIVPDPQPEESKDIVLIPTVPPQIVLSYNEFFLNEPVSFSLKNQSSSDLLLKNGAPWIIQDSSGVTVFTPVSTQAQVIIKSGQAQAWRWMQDNEKGIRVGPGQYKVVFPDSGVSTSFGITSKVGSSGKFTFYVGDSSKQIDPERIFSAYLTNPKAIREAIENYYGQNNKFPYGKVIDDRPGKSPYDSRWSWHLDPQSTEMGDTAIELCDAWPQFVENNLDYWLEKVKVFCPWGARVMALN